MALIGPDPGMPQSTIDAISALTFVSDHWEDANGGHYHPLRSGDDWTVSTAGALTIDQTSAGSLAGAAANTDGSYTPSAYPTLRLALRDEGNGHAQAVLAP